MSHELSEAVWSQSVLLLSAEKLFLLFLQLNCTFLRGQYNVQWRFSQTKSCSFKTNPDRPEVTTPSEDHYIKLMSIWDVSNLQSQLNKECPTPLSKSKYWKCSVMGMLHGFWSWWLAQDLLHSGRSTLRMHATPSGLFIFQQDNDPEHASKLNQGWQKARKEHAVLLCTQPYWTSENTFEKGKTCSNITGQSLKCYKIK